MTRFEYKIVDSVDVPAGGLFKDKTKEQVEAYLDDLGRQGWEVISFQLSEHEGRLSFIGLAKRLAQGTS